MNAKVKHTECDSFDDEPMLIDRDKFCDAMEKLRGKANKVFGYILEYSFVICEHYYFFVGSISEISKESGISRQTVSKAIKTMEEIELLINQSKKGWLINPQIMFYDKNPEKYMPLDDEE